MNNPTKEDGNASDGNHMPPPCWIVPNLLPAYPNRAFVFGPSSSFKSVIQRRTLPPADKV
jgi:hypothetical protein